MMNIKVTVPVFLLMVAVVLSCACSDRTAGDLPLEEDDRQLPDQVITGFGITITDEGVKKTQVDAEEAYVFEESEHIAAKYLNVKFFSSSGEYFSQLWADSGTIDMETNDMFAVGNVIVLTKDSLRLETETLRWDEEAEQISTEDSVVFYQEDKIVRGRGLYSDPGLDDVVILSPSGRFKDKDRTDKD